MKLCCRMLLYDIIQTYLSGCACSWTINKPTLWFYMFMCDTSMLMLTQLHWNSISHALKSIKIREKLHFNIADKKALYQCVDYIIVDLIMVI